MGLVIIQDSREQQPLDFSIGKRVIRVEVKGMPWADYWGSTEEGIEFPISFERKNMGDLFQTLTSGMDRFKRELERASKMDCRVYLAIEGSLSDVYAGYEHSSVSGNQIVKTLMTLRVKYGVEPIFCNSTHEMKAQIIETFEAIERNYKKAIE